ncbi:MAG TPA: TetR/AcrR family transcriptional regulator [Mucilaginibacter sp.]|jgi:AcrR family transcriptional regulator|nr:TetR/AcrR family transcriptional regulator [Mucilaginibacter sp.]
MTKANIDISTEEKLKEAARAVFTRKGYAAAKVRDIAAEANINLALVNYYFRSKEKLFELIMDETIQKLFDKIQKIINDESSTITEKVENVVDHYISLLLENPELPLFFLSEVMSGSNKLTRMTNNGKVFFNSHFVKQLAALQAEGKIKFHPVNLMMNMIGMIVFPFLARPLLLKSGALGEKEFRAIVEERKKLIPLWLTQMTNM